MSNYMKVKQIRKYRRNRRRAERLGGWLLLIGFMIVYIFSGESELSFGVLCLIGFVGIVLMGLGAYIINYIEQLNQESPLRYDLVAEGDDLWYNMYIKQKRSDEND